MVPTGVWSVVPLSISESASDYARKVTDCLKGRGLRAESDLRGEKLGAKIREAELMKIPYMLIVGGKERESGSVSVRSKKNGDLGSVPLDRFAQDLVKEVADKI